MAKRIRFKTDKGRIKQLAINDIKESANRCYIFDESRIRWLGQNRNKIISINTCFL